MFDWDTLCQRARGRTDISESEKESAIIAFQSLKRIFGGQFFDPRHPLFADFMNQAPWVKKWAAWFAILLSKFESNPDFQQLIMDLKSADRYIERMQVLQVAARLATGGFDIQFDVPVAIQGIQKKPDLLVLLNANAYFFVEVSALSSSDKERSANDIARQFFDTIDPLALECFSGRIEKLLSAYHLAEILREMKRVVESAKLEKTTKALEVDGVFCLAVGPPGSESEVAAWSRERGLKLNELVGPPFSVLEFDRLAHKLKVEQHQLPRSTANVVVLYARPFVSNPGDRAHFETVVHNFEEEVYKYPHIAFVCVVFEGMITNPSNIHSLRDHLCINRQQMIFVCDTTFVLKNKFASPLMDPATENAFIAALASPRLLDG